MRADVRTDRGRSEPAHRRLPDASGRERITDTLRKRDDETSGCERTCGFWRRGRPESSHNTGKFGRYRKRRPGSRKPRRFAMHTARVPRYVARLARKTPCAWPSLCCVLASAGTPPRLQPRKGEVKRRGFSKRLGSCGENRAAWCQPRKTREDQLLGSAIRSSSWITTSPSVIRLARTRGA